MLPYMANTKRRPIVVDLFAGAGGLGVGASLAGANVAASVEIDRVACETLTANKSYHGEIIQEDAASIKGTDLVEPSGRPVIVIGGPPCQPFSKASYWTDSGEESRYRRNRAKGVTTARPAPPKDPRPDARRDLVYEFWRLVREMDAAAFVFENVPSIRHPRNKPVLEKLVSDAECAGYKVTVGLLDASSYGVAQKRQRVFVIGSKGAKPPLPNPTHSSDGTTPLLAPTVSSREMLEQFNCDKYFEEEEVVRGKWADALKEVPPGWNYKALTEWAGHPKPLFEAETRFWNFLLKLSPELPSWTIAANPGPWVGPFHWESRRLRTPELAALQSFPDGYVFAGNRRARVRQIGNAVPPLLAKRVVESVIEATC
jgi:DNA (cytosine-5)-methyltransferase 1